MTIGESIDVNLSGFYNIEKQIINFKDYGSNSSRTRTLFIGVRKDLKDITPYDIFPSKENNQTLREIIGKYPPLKIMGEISQQDIYHHFRKYSPNMIEWIKDIKEGQSAFDNLDPLKIPHRIVNGKIIYNKNKNGDKYTRCFWDKVAPCIHTRNDIMSIQATIHPKDNRVFSIRELMDLMTIPNSFNWQELSFESLNSLSLSDKEKFLKQEAINIRQAIGEAVPTVIFNKIAKNIIKAESKTITNKYAKEIFKREELFNNTIKLYQFIKQNNDNFTLSSLSKIAEFANAERDNLSAFYTTQSISYSLLKELPDFKGKTALKILKPAVGLGSFINLLAVKYQDKKIQLDVIEKNSNTVELLKLLQNSIALPNITINYINADFLSFVSDVKYDIVVGNPPFGKVDNKSLLVEYSNNNNFYNKDTSNLFSLFLEKALLLGDYVAFITPKSLLNATEFNKTRELIENNYTVKSIIDYGENGFNVVKIETIGIILKNLKNEHYDVKIESYITQSIHYINNENLFDSDFNTWLIYKNEFFIKIKETLLFVIYTSFRDRIITKKLTKCNGKIRVLKSRNIGNNKVINIENYDTYINSLENLAVAKFINSNTILVPNFTYDPRACFMPENCIADGSVAI
jgi:DNA (cytosine-5)-methyltransferase 1